ncbi:hypothetical protein HDU91_006432 [Kappamyces sp. JEL0680]|nr:hypothetical protein HDU91_006432 [Kappamyces sp. JEL0680]
MNTTLQSLSDTVNSIPANISPTTYQRLPAAGQDSPSRPSRNEVLSSVANRLLHSKYYKIFYLLMASLSLVCLVTSLSTSCPAPWFYMLEFLVLIAMGLEFGIRYMAVGKKYWNSVANVVDTIVVCLCILTFMLLLSHTCGEASSREAVLEEMLLLGRNGIQLTRLVLMMRRWASPG